MSCYVQGCDKPVDSKRSGTFCAECLDELWQLATAQHQAKRFRARLLREGGIDVYDNHNHLEKPK